MMIFKLLFYSIYNIFKLVPRRKPIDHVLATKFLSILIYTNLITCLFPLRLLHIRVSGIGMKIIIICFLLIFVAIYYFSKWYFLKKENYKIIISRYDSKYFSSLYNVRIFGIIYIIGTFSFFILLAFYLNKY